VHDPFQYLRTGIRPSPFSQGDIYFIGSRFKV
jgi:hypothetical protein